MAKIPIKTLVDKNGRKHDIFCKIKIISGETWYYLTDDNKHYLESKQIESGCEKLLFIINNNL